MRRTGDMMINRMSYCKVKIPLHFKKHYLAHMYYSVHQAVRANYDFTYLEKIILCGVISRQVSRTYVSV